MFRNIYLALSDIGLTFNDIGLAKPPIDRR